MREKYKRISGRDSEAWLTPTSHPLWSFKKIKWLSTFPSLPIYSPLGPNAHLRLVTLPSPPLLSISSPKQPYLWISLTPKGGRELYITPFHFADVVSGGIHLGCQVKHVDAIFGHNCEKSRGNQTPAPGRGDHQPPNPSPDFPTHHSHGVQVPHRLMTSSLGKKPE